MSHLSNLSISPELKEVESLVRSKFESEAGLLSEVSSYLLALGGKRIRPIFTLLCAKLLGAQAPFTAHTRGQQIIEIAAGIELIHMATLLHDDIIDKSPLRRHKRSAFVEYGSNTTLLAGDFLLVRAFGLCAKLDRFVIEATERACVSLTEGEILEAPLSQHICTVEDSLEIARKKTASLFRLGAESAAHITGCSDSVKAAMAKFGEDIGMCFQIVDDILDVTSSRDLLGKETGQDLRERKPSLVNVLWLQSGHPLAKKLLVEPEEVENDFVEQALQMLPASEFVAEARRLARHYRESALQVLQSSVGNHLKLNKDHLSELIALVDFVLRRAA